MKMWQVFAMLSMIVLVQCIPEKANAPASTSQCPFYTTSVTVKNLNELKAAVKLKNVVITMAPGTNKYIGQVVVNQAFVKIIGNSNTISCNAKYDDFKSNKATACLQILANATDFKAVHLNVENTAGPLGKQALAAFVQGDRAVFHNCKFAAFQDTLFVSRGKQYFRSCRISGAKDFIYGDGAAVFENCRIHVRIDKNEPNQVEEYFITAPGKTLSPGAGIFISDSIVTADDGLKSVALGRGWGDSGQAVFQNTRFKGNFIDPKGWYIVGANKTKSKLRGFQFGAINCKGLPQPTWPKEPRVVSKPVNLMAILENNAGCKDWYE